MAMTDPAKQRKNAPMAPHLKLIAGGKTLEGYGKVSLPAAMAAEIELIIAQYIEGMLTQLEALSRLLAIEGLANSLEGVRQEARDVVRQLGRPV